MWDNIREDRHFLGEFNLGGKNHQGEIIYNKESGIIILKILRQVNFSIGESYGSFSLITGVLHSGAVVSLYHNVCIRNHTQNFAYQELLFRSNQIIFGHTNNYFNQLVCVLENGWRWSKLSQLDMSDFLTIKHKNIDERIYNWFGAKIIFSTELTNELTSFPRKEVSRVIERLVVTIESEEKKEASFFVQIRDKVMSLISFAIKDNVNIEDQHFVDFDDYDTFQENKIYSKKTFVTSEPYCHISDTSPLDYNFTLEQLSDSVELQNTLIKLEPVFNLYLSLFKYRYMPVEMVFLNIVQALETFHARFFYEDKKEKYVQSVYDRFKESPHYEKIKKLLLNDTQMDEKCGFIILVSRLNDLLIGQFNGLFCDFYMKDDSYAQQIADTRHYYTHYGKSKEAKALKGDDLLNAIYILRLLLEYHICKVLGIDIDEKTRHALSIYMMDTE